MVLNTVMIPHHIPRQNMKAEKPSTTLKYKFFMRLQLVSCSNTAHRDTIMYIYTYIYIYILQSA